MYQGNYKRESCSFSSSLSHFLGAQNPIIRISLQLTNSQVFEGKLYLYPSHDIPSLLNGSGMVCMADYHVFSSDNLVDWEDHGVLSVRVGTLVARTYSMGAIVSIGMANITYFPHSRR